MMVRHEAGEADTQVSDPNSYSKLQTPTYYIIFYIIHQSEMYNVSFCLLFFLNPHPHC